METNWIKAWLRGKQPKRRRKRRQKRRQKRRRAKQAWAWEEEDSEEEEVTRIKPSRVRRHTRHTKVVPFVLQHDEADEAGYKAGYEADEADYKVDEAGYEADGEAGFMEDETDDKWGDEVEDERYGGACCFPFLRLGRSRVQVPEGPGCGNRGILGAVRRSREQVPEGPGRRNRGILGALRRWFDRRRGT
ncbi:hypothetical protein FKM82_029442 [Ascaphus truei]